jgi:hypothetical protein
MDTPSNPSSRPPSPSTEDDSFFAPSGPPHHEGPAAPSVPRKDAARILCLFLLPLLLCVTYWVPLASTAPTREELRDALRNLDEAAYRNSGCSEVGKLLLRCETIKCPAKYVYELKQLNRNCRTLRCVWAPICFPA